MGLKDSFAAKVRENEAREAAIRANPALANTPEVKRQRRFVGFVIFLLGIVLAIADLVSWETVGSMLIFFIAVPIVFIPSGIYMMVAGKNPFLKMKR